MASVDVGRFGVLFDTIDSDNDDDAAARKGKKGAQAGNVQKSGGKATAKNAKRRAKKRAAKAATSGSQASNASE